MIITKPKRDMRNNIRDIGEAFIEALEYCRIYGLNWKEHVRPIIEESTLKGYWVLDETKSTIVKRIEIE